MPRLAVDHARLGWNTTGMHKIRLGEGLVRELREFHCLCIYIYLFKMWRQTSLNMAANPL